MVDAKGVMSLNALKFGNVDVYDALLDLNEKVDELMAWADMMTLSGKNVSMLDLLVAGDGLKITGASSAAYAVDLSSGGAIRITAGGGNVYIESGGNYIQIGKSGTITFNANTVDFSYVNNIVGLPTG